MIDTDVLLDFFFDRQPYSDHAELILSLCESKKVAGYVTPVICSNVYYILRQTAGHTRVVEKLKQLLLIINSLQMDGDVILRALNSGFSDFEDSLQNFAAVRSKQIDVIITRNVKDYRKSELSVMTPDHYLKQLNH